MEEINYASSYLSPKIGSGLCQARSTFTLWGQQGEVASERETGKGSMVDMAFEFTLEV